MKRIMSFLLAFCLIVSGLAFPAAGQENPDIKVNISTGEVTISVTGAAGAPATVKIAQGKEYVYLDSAILNADGSHTFKTVLPLNGEYDASVNIDQIISQHKIFTKPAPPADLKAIQKSAEEYLLKNVSDPKAGPIGGDWTVLGLARANAKVPRGYYEGYLQDTVAYIKKEIDEADRLDSSKSSENSRLILALTSIGKDVEDMDGHNLLNGLADLKYLVKEGIQGPIMALIALDAYDYTIPENKDATVLATREELITCILDAQAEDGGWSGVEAESDVQTTAMAIQSLAPYCKMNRQVAGAVDKAIQYLSEVQANNGGFLAPQDGKGMANACDATAQVIIALTALGIDPDSDARFIKNGFSCMDALCGFASVSGGFRNVHNGEVSTMATERAYCALTAYNRLINKETSLYDMIDVTVSHNPDIPIIPDNPDQPEDVTKPSPDDPNHTHSYTWVITKQATKDAPGKLTGTCICGDTQVRELPVLGTSGNIIIEEGKGNACSTKLDRTDAVSHIPLTEQELETLIQGTDLIIGMNVIDISGSVSASDKDLIKKSAGNQTVGLYLDITLFKQFADSSKIAVHETEGAVKISLVVPENLRKAGRTFGIIRLHDGVATALKTSFDEKSGMMRFESDRFSTYALVYSEKDSSNPTQPTTAPTSPTNNGGNGGGAPGGSGGGPHTGDANSMITIAAVFAASLIGLAALAYLGRKQKNHR